jgi:glyoxylase-like metal-dependent hydrolase (beta-lactamase superfamily II)
VHLHRDDLFLYEQAVQHGLMFGLRVDPPPPVDEFYSPGDVFRFGDYAVRPHHTPGHCPGGVCLAVEQDAKAGRAREAGRTGETEPARGAGFDLFVGDTLFAGSIGRTDLPGADHATLIASIRNVLFAFGDDARVYPGHGPATTIGHERRTNPFLN